MDRPLAFRGIERIQILCLVQSEGVLAPESDRDRICSAVKAEASKGAGLAVELLSIGDPGVIAPRRLTLLVHAAIDGHGGERQAILSIRPYRADADGSAVLFGAMPRRAPLADDAALEAAVAASLDEILPWRQANSGDRRID